MLDAFGGWYIKLTDYNKMLISAQQGTLTWSTGYARTEREVWNDWQDAQLCALDEIGARKDVSDHHNETLQACIDKREGKPLVVISNYDLAAISGLYGDRIASRLSAGTIITMMGDRRNTNGRYVTVKPQLGSYISR